MVQALAQGLRLAQHYLELVISRLWWIISTPAFKWLEFWNSHRSTIIFLAVVNTTLTTASEFGSRTIISSASHRQQDGFLIQTMDGSTRVHRQSLINIVMTLIATLIGGPVYFIGSRWNRFVFFITFGVFNSILSQGLSSIFLEGIPLIIGRRLAFDFTYNATVKFVLFEFVRPFLVAHRQSPIKVTFFRVGQDFLTTCIRVLILNILKLSGH